MSENCKICSGKSQFVFSKRVLQKYDVSYYLCSSCGFLQTEKPFWLEEAYLTPMAKYDLGILTRVKQAASLVSCYIKNTKTSSGEFLDFGSGYGIFVRTMRDFGYDFKGYDKYTKDLFGGLNTYESLPSTKKFELITALEVIEHIEDPKAELTTLFEHTDTIVLSTELSPSTNELSEWHYLSNLAGQHISLFSYESMKQLASALGVHYIKLNNQYHALTKQSGTTERHFKPSVLERLYAKLNPDRSPQSSLLTSDSEELLQTLIKSGTE